jgi:c(7)-type cytochrome triheme protein
MKKLILLMALILVSALATNVFAVPKGKTITFAKSSLGPVVFDGTLHNGIAKSCGECHNPQLFPKMKQGTVSITMKNIYAGEQCGFCHNGERAFKAQVSCKNCHKK